eukprot:2354025-Amphidinium_carterae.1
MLRIKTTFANHGDVVHEAREARWGRTPTCLRSIAGNRQRLASHPLTRLERHGTWPRIPVPRL